MQVRAECATTFREVFLKEGIEWCEVGPRNQTTSQGISMEQFTEPVEG